MSKPFPAVTAASAWRATAPRMSCGEEDLDADDTGDDTANDDSADAGGAEAAAAAADAKAIERQARAQGWRPEAEFKGDGKWVDAATFVERGNKFKKNLEREVETLKREVAEGKKTREQFAAFHREAMAKKDAEIDAALRKARLDHKEAIRNGEDDTALHLEDRIDTLKEEKAKIKADVKAAEEEPKKEETAASGDDAALTEWIADGNEWFRDNHKLRAYAMAIGQEMRAAGDMSRDRKFLDKIRAQMEDEMPDAFPKDGSRVGNPLRKRAGAAETGAGGAQSPQGKTERDLPKADRELMERFVADGLMTKAQFLKDYKWSN